MRAKIPLIFAFFALNSKVGKKNFGVFLIRIEEMESNDKGNNLSCKRPPTFKFKLGNGKSYIKMRISPIVIKLISFGD